MENVIQSLLDNKIVVIVRGVDQDKPVLFVEAIYNGGIRFMECTYDASGRIPDEQIAGNIKLLADRFDDRMHIGAGTVITEK